MEACGFRAIHPRHECRGLPRKTLVTAAVFCVFLADVGMSVVARVLPQGNVFLLSIPVKIVAGLSVLALSMPLMGPVLSRIFESVFRYWGALPGR